MYLLFEYLFSIHWCSRNSKSHFEQICLLLRCELAVRETELRLNVGLGAEINFLIVVEQ